MSTQFPGYSLSFVQSMLTEQSGRASGWFKDLELRTVFQPAFSLPHKKAVGFQANLRGAGEDGSAVEPAAMFGPVDERAYGPYGSDVTHTVLTEPVPCRPCYKDFRFPPCQYDRRCLELLPVERAVHALEKIA